MNLGQSIKWASLSNCFPIEYLFRQLQLQKSGTEVAVWPMYVRRSGKCTQAKLQQSCQEIKPSTSLHNHFLAEPMTYHSVGYNLQSLTRISPMCLMEPCQPSEGDACQPCLDQYLKLSSWLDTGRRKKPQILRRTARWEILSEGVQTQKHNKIPWMLFLKPFYPCKEKQISYPSQNVVCKHETLQIYGVKTRLSICWHSNYTLANVWLW